MQYINFNGNIYPEHEALLPVNNRAFRYGDAFVETMVMFNKKVPLLEYHWSRIMFSKEVFSATLPPGLDVDKLENMLLDLASVNDAVKNARVRMQFYRKGKGFFFCPRKMSSASPSASMRWRMNVSKWERGCAWASKKIATSRFRW